MRRSSAGFGIAESTLRVAENLSVGEERAGKFTASCRVTSAATVDTSQPRSQGFSIFVIGKAGKGPGTGRSSMYSDWSMTSTLLCK
jgi:hypothetical protein